MLPIGEVSNMDLLDIGGPLQEAEQVWIAIFLIGWTLVDMKCYIWKWNFNHWKQLKLFIFLSLFVFKQ